MRADDEEATAGATVAAPCYSKLYDYKSVETLSNLARHWLSEPLTAFPSGGIESVKILGEHAKSVPWACGPIWSKRA